MSNNVRSWFTTAIHESAQEMKQESKLPLFLGYPLFFIIYLPLPSQPSGAVFLLQLFMPLDKPGALNHSGHF